MERYGDYNEVGESPSKSPVLGFIKLVAIILCFAVVGLLLLRLLLFNYVPASVKDIYFTDALTAHYNATGGNIGAKTQTLRAQYDDAKEGNFFCDNLIVIPEIGELQITLRYNISLIDKLKEEYGLTDIDENSDDLFIFRLRRNGEVTDDCTIIGELRATRFESFILYRYYKLVFDGIDFESESKIEWIRLEILVKNTDQKEPYMVAIYENNETYSKFTDYKLSGGEVPG